MRDAIGPYETRQQAADDARPAYEAARANPALGVMVEANHGALLDACKAAGVYLGAHDHLVVRWLAGWEPDTVQVMIGLLSRANTGGAL